MKIIGLNGSPRREWNTAQMVKSALDGAKSAGAEVVYYDLFAMDFKGCSSCFGCKRLGGTSYGKCAMRDELTQVLDDVLSSDGFFLGAPIYYGDVTACVRAFLERLWFAGMAYSSGERNLYPKKVPCRLLFTMNAPFENFHKHLNESVVGAMTNLVGPTELIEAVGTKQFDDFSKYETSMFDVPTVLKRHEEVFPLDLEKAYDAGVALAQAK